MENRVGRIYEAAWLHHACGLSQKVVAGKLRVDKATISRWIQEAARCGIVSVTVTPPGLKDLETRLQAAFGLKRVRVIPSLPMSLVGPDVTGNRERTDAAGRSDRQEVLTPSFAEDFQELQNEELGKAAAAFIGPTLVGGAGVGLGGGRAVSAFARHLYRDCPRVGLKFFALAVSSREPFAICATSITAICTSLVSSEFRRPASQAVPAGGAGPPHVEGHALRLPERGADFAAMAKAADDYYDAAMEQVELVVTGIGAIETCWVLDDTERHKLAREMGAVGDVLYDIYGDAGTPIKVKPAAAVFPFGIKRLQRMVADGKDVVVITTGKAKATYHALACKGRPFVTGIVTDEQTARDVLALNDKAGR